MVNWDNALAYSTIKVVKVRDWRLGCMHYFFQVAIFLYIVLYAVTFDQGFMYKEQIVGGSVTLNSRAPNLNDFGVENYAQNFSYCCESDDAFDCQNGTKPLNDTLKCLSWDSYLAEYPTSSNLELAITSRVTISSETVNDPATCTETNWPPTCEYIDDGAGEESFYIAGFEGYTIRIRHGCRGQIVDRQGVSTGEDAMSGKLVSTSGKTLRFWPDETPFAGQPQDDTRSGDIISVAELLEAAGLNLDEDFTSMGEISPRYDGINVLVNIEYEMVGIPGLTLRYVYKPRVLSALEYKIEEAIYTNARQSRTIYNRHGARFIFVQTGVVGTFDFQSLLVTLVTALGLLAVATTVTDLMMLNILENRKTYGKYKVLETEAFGDFRKLPEEEQKKIENRIGRSDGIYEDEIPTPPAPSKSTTNGDQSEA